MCARSTVTAVILGLLYVGEGACGDRFKKVCFRVTRRLVLACETVNRALTGLRGGLRTIIDARRFVLRLACFRSTTRRLVRACAIARGALRRLRRGLCSRLSVRASLHQGYAALGVCTLDCEGSTCKVTRVTERAAVGANKLALKL